METQKDNTSNSARVQLDHILLATNLLQDSKILILLDEFGEVALGRYIHLITCIGREGGSMPEVACYALGRLLGVPKEDWVKFVTACSEVGLVTIDNKEVSISRLIKQSEKVANQQRRWRENKKTQEDFREDSSENPQRTKRDSESESKEEEKEEEQEKENKSKKNSQPVPQPEIPPDDPELKFANDQLEDPNTPKVRNSSVFMATGQRPIRKYPALWLTPHELRDVFRIAQESGLPRNKLEILFKPINGWAMKQVAKGRPPDSLNAFGALTGWGLQDALKTLKQAKDLERSEFYLNNAKA